MMSVLYRSNHLIKALLRISLLTAIFFNFSLLTFSVFALIFSYGLMESVKSYLKSLETELSGNFWQRLKYALVQDKYLFLTFLSVIVVILIGWQFDTHINMQEWIATSEPNNLETRLKAALEDQNLAKQKALWILGIEIFGAINLIVWSVNCIKQ